MRTTSAQNFTGTDLGKQVAIEVQADEGKRLYARGLLKEWGGVWSETSINGQDRMFRAVLLIDSGNHTQVMLAHDSILWVQDDPSELLPSNELEVN